MPNYKYNEDKILEELKNYVDKTYSQHYVDPKTDVQVLDIWNSLGSVETTLRDNVIKYAMRFGKKDGRNVKDLMKILHYTILWIHFVREAEGKQIEPDAQRQALVKKAVEKGWFDPRGTTVRTQVDLLPRNDSSLDLTLTDIPTRY